MSSAFALADVRFGIDGLVPVVAQDERTGDVLMLAWSDREALEATMRTGQVHYHSRSRGRLWKKGEESGNVQELVSLHLDCDGDAVLALVRQTGPACHTGAATCFAPPDGEAPRSIVAALAALVESRKKTAPPGSYTAKLLADPNLSAKKIGEESVELAMALRAEGPDQVAHEAADVLYHVLVACAGAGVTWVQIAEELGRRRP